MLKTLKERFYAKVLVNPSDPDGCWEWNASKNSRGYGQIGRAGSQSARAHRISWEIHRGEAPAELDHICRNRGCVNPEHLRPATRHEQVQNLGVGRNNTSGYRGVSWNKRESKYYARVQCRGKSYFFGLHDTAEEAAEAARQGRLKLFTHNELDRA